MAISLADVEQQIGAFFGGTTKHERPAPAEPRDNKARPGDAMALANAGPDGVSAMSEMDR